jgi:hypothetical protein
LSLATALDVMTQRKFTNWLTLASATSRLHSSRFLAFSSDSVLQKQHPGLNPGTSSFVREANAIGTAYLRLDLLPASEQPAIRHLFRDYLDARLQAYEKFAHQEASEIEFAWASALQGQIWSQALTASRADQTQDSARLLLPALSEMIDVATSRAVGQKIHLPALVFYLLIGIALLSGLLAGYAMSKRQTRSWFHALIYASIISITVYVIFDFDNPRFGLIKVDAADTALIQLRDSIR